MSSTLDSYRPRNTGLSVIHCERLGENGGCWGDVTMTSHGYRCRGHRDASGYTKEPVPLTPEQIEALRQKQEAEEARKKAEWEARRWFRPIENQIRDPHPFLTPLSDTMLKAIFSMVGEGLTVGMETNASKAALLDFAPFVVSEVKRRGLEWPLGYYALKLAPEWESMRTIHIGRRDSAYYTPFNQGDLAVDLTKLSDEHLMVLYGCAAQVVDYSCLERGARQVGDHVWQQASAELENRGLTPEFLFDWEG